MSSSKGKINKNTWCKGALGTFLKKNGFNVKNIYSCSYGSSCRNAHEPSELKKKSDILNWERKNKKNINLLEMETNLRTCLEKLSKLKNSKFSSKTPLLQKMDFKEMLDLWFEVACFQRKLIKEQHSSSNIDGVYLDNENNYWSLQRSLNLCPKNNDLMCKYNSKSPIQCRDICVGSFNCKLGVHSKRYLVCYDDLMNGKCCCMSLQEYNKIKEAYEKIIEENKDDHSIVKKYQEKLRNHIRIVHFTDDGMIPLNIHKERLKQEQEAEKVVVNSNIVAKKIKKKSFATSSK